jgi:PAS domain S-box-containing protein
MKNFFSMLRSFFASPVFEGDTEKTQAAKLLYQIVMVIWGLPILLTIMFLAGRAEVVPPALIISITLLTLMVFTRLGWIGLASTIITGMIFLVFVYADFQNVGNIQPSTLVTAIAIIMSGLLLGRRAPLVMAILIAVSHAIIVYLQMQGLIKLTSAPALGNENIVITGIMVLMIGFLFQFVISRLQFALDEARKNEGELQVRNHELEELSKSLEQRVANRTQALSSVAEIGTAVSTTLETNKLLQQVVDLSKERFNFYHAHIYLLNETSDMLLLSSGAGEVGRQMVAERRSIRLDQEQSLVARAAREKKGITVNDVTATPEFLPNPLLPDTRSELAVPMIVGEQLIGVFDVQSEVVGRFTEADIAVQTTLASQVASAVQNAHSYSEVQRSQALLSEALNISRLANWEYDFEHDLFNFNDHFYSIFRTTVERVGGYKISSADYARNFVHPDDQALVGSEIQRVLETKERYYSTALEHRIIFADGEVGYISVRINVERDGNGKILRWYGANQDVTERRRLEELNHKRAIQQEAINLITQKIQSATTIEEAMQVAARELGHALGKRQTLVSLGPSALSSNGKSVVNE